MKEAAYELERAAGRAADERSGSLKSMCDAFQTAPTLYIFLINTVLYSSMRVSGRPYAE